MKSPTLILAMAMAATLSGPLAANAPAVKIVGGTPVDPKDYPHCVILAHAVGDKWAACTGTFLNDTTVLTAAHCMNHSAPANDLIAIINGARVEALNVFWHPGYDLEAADYWRARRYDIAIVVFPEGTGASLGITSYPKLATVSPRAGEQVQLLGYGSTTLTPDSSSIPTLHRGVSAPINGMSDENFGVQGTVGRYSWANHGDSGSAQYNRKGEIVGVCSNGGLSAFTGGRAYNNFKNVVGPNSLDVFDRAINCLHGPCAQEFRPGHAGDDDTPPPVATPGTKLGITVTSQADWLNGRYLLVISGVTPGGAADNSGIAVGDILWTVNGQHVQTMAKVTELLQASDGYADIVVYRGRQPMSFNRVELQ